MLWPDYTADDEKRVKEQRIHYSMLKQWVRKHAPYPHNQDLETIINMAAWAALIGFPRIYVDGKDEKAIEAYRQCSGLAEGDRNNGAVKSAYRGMDQANVGPKHQS